MTNEIDEINISDDLYKLLCNKWEEIIINYQKNIK